MMKKNGRKSIIFFLANRKLTHERISCADKNKQTREIKKIMSGQPSTIYSLCFRSQDSTRTENGYQFGINSTVSRVKPSRVVLGSIEMPLSQPTICKEWSRIYFCERIPITTSCRKLSFTVRMMEEGNVASETIHLPIELNPIKRVEVGSSGTVTVTTEFDHGLTAEIVKQVGVWGEVSTLATTVDASLLDSAKRGTFQVLDETRFSFQSPSTTPSSTATDVGYVFCPSPSSPSALCALIEVALEGTSLSPLLSCSYDQEKNKAEVRLKSLPPSSKGATVEIRGDGLCTRIGLSQTFERKDLGASSLSPGVGMMDSSSRQLNVSTGNFGPLEGGGPYIVPSNPFPFPYCELREGWYAPAKRAVPTAQPKRLSSEFDISMNRLFLRPSPEGDPPTLVFLDPYGNLKRAVLTPGRYTPRHLASSLTSSMNGTGTSVYSVTFNRNRFEFVCQDSGNRGAPTTFSLLFNHPDCIDGARLGFEDNLSYDGSSSYTGGEVHVPQLQWPPSASQPSRRPSNTYHLQEASHNGRMKIVPKAPPSVIAVIRSYQSNSLLLKTYGSGGSPFSSGFEPGSVVHIGSPQESVSIGGSTVSSVSSVFTRGVVLPHTTDEEVKLSVGPNFQWSDARGKAVILSVPIQPSTFCFSSTLKNSIGGRLGFESRSHEWGSDGVVTLPVSGLKIPPFQAGGLPDLDHPDYILVYLHEGKRSSLMHHFTAGQATNPFAKLVLYEAAYREDRQLTRDLVLSSGESMNRFTIQFRNPDGTEYCLSSPFSFTLNFVV